MLAVFRKGLLLYQHSFQERKTLFEGRNLNLGYLTTDSARSATTTMPGTQAEYLPFTPIVVVDHAGNVIQSAVLAARFAFGPQTLDATKPLR